MALYLIIETSLVYGEVESVKTTTCGDVDLHLYVKEIPTKLHQTVSTAKYDATESAIRKGDIVDAGIDVVSATLIVE